MTSDELADLLPRWHRIADEPGGEPLRALLSVIAEQIERVRGEVGQTYANWFVETADEWALPLIGELVGYRPLAGYQRVLSAGLRDGGPAAESARRLAEALAPRRDVAATAGYRRRKGTLSLLEELSPWPARAVENSRLLAHTQPVRLFQPGRVPRGSLADLRDGAALDLIGTPFAAVARTVDLRSGGVELFVWRLAAHPVTRAPANCVDSARNLFTFSVLGNDTRLVTKPEPEPSTTHLATVDNVPAYLRRRLFADRLADYYGPGKSVAIWRADRLVPMSAIVVADLTGWRCQPRRDQVVVDPELGRIAFSPRSGPGEECGSATTTRSATSSAAASIRATCPPRTGPSSTGSGTVRSTGGSPTPIAGGATSGPPRPSSRSPTTVPTRKSSASSWPRGSGSRCAPPTGSGRCCGCSTGRATNRTRWRSGPPARARR
ncbi:hypothetical protein [Paractinoplanes durhamensis]|uniref:hypothetical protein n=1 Tax=Paractinoplanes durhamensis TaxID=113563 RepID=UPI0036404F1F